MKKPKPLSSYKAKLWKIFSEFIRLRDSNLDGQAMCVTCDKWMPWKEGQAGHFIQGRTNGILFDERNVHFQCAPCNIWKHGNLENYYPFMMDKYSQSVIDDLKRLKRQLVKLDSTWYENHIEYYIEQVRLLKIQKGF